MKLLGTLIVAAALLVFVQRNQKMLGLDLPRFQLNPPQTEEQKEAVRQNRAVSARVEAMKKQKDGFYYKSLNVVRRYLKAPTTAKFSNYITDPHTGALLRDDGNWEAFGSVNAQNVFGVPLRHDWRLIASADLQPIYFQLGDEIVGSIPAAPTPVPKAGDWMKRNGRTALDRKPY